jgi:hypothetical protein
MKNTLKYIGILFLAMVLFTNCQKDNKGNDVKDPGEVSFAVLDGNMDKSDIFDIECIEGVEAVKARINLNGDFYYPELFMLDGVLYTQSLKLDPGDYTINEFSLLSADDVVLKSTPMAGSYYAQFLDENYAIGELPTFTINPFEKNQFDVEVLCYIEAAYNGFGFEWFDITELTVREQCFFGDFCIKDVNQYVNSLYDGNGVTIDEVAIFKIVLTANYDDPIEYYNFNDGVYTSPLCIEYVDYENIEDTYLFELYIYVTSGDDWDYVKFYEWTVVDDEMIPAGDDGVVDFVLGNCVMDTPDLLLPPWMNLPASFDFKVLTGTSSYIRTVLSNIPDGYDIVDGTFNGWCADKFNTIYTNTNYPGTQALSSLYPNNLPGTWPTKWEAIASANWIFNTYPPTDDPAVYTKAEIQDALWILFDSDDGYVSTTVNGALLAAAAADHTSYSPLPGGWAAVFYYVGSDGVQMTFDVVDP